MVYDHSELSAIQVLMKPAKSKNQSTSLFLNLGIILLTGSQYSRFKSYRFLFSFGMYVQDNSSDAICRCICSHANR